jgi:AP-3 complex subunit beta
LGSNLDPDHRLILRSCIPLLKSRNSAVVLAVASIHFYCGGRGSAADVQIGKALVRILRNQREIQYVLLSSIVTMAQERPAMFKPYLADFYVKSSDPVFNKYVY